MASLLFGAIVLTYDAIAKALRRRRSAKTDREARFATLERDNAARIARLRSERCDCGGDHVAAEHPGGPFVRDGAMSHADDTVIRNEDEGQDPRAGRTDDGPPPYDEVVAGGGR